MSDCETAHALANELCLIRNIQCVDSYHRQLFIKKNQHMTKIKTIF